jgi:hypothetical protein
MTPAVGPHGATVVAGTSATAPLVGRCLATRINPSTTGRTKWAARICTCTATSRASTLGAAGILISSTTTGGRGGANRWVLDMHDVHGRLVIEKGHLLRDESFEREEQVIVVLVEE